MGYFFYLTFFWYCSIIFFLIYIIDKFLPTFIIGFSFSPIRRTYKLQNKFSFFDISYLLDHIEHQFEKEC